ncbi:hypothetical protein V1281_004217 [Nitrobacteraceae bacterium AZCC 2161]
MRADANYTSYCPPKKVDYTCVAMTPERSVSGVEVGPLWFDSLLGFCLCSLAQAAITFT